MSLLCLRPSIEGLSTWKKFESFNIYYKYFRPITFCWVQHIYKTKQKNYDTYEWNWIWLTSSSITTSYLKGMQKPVSLHILIILRHRSKIVSGKEMWRKSKNFRTKSKLATIVFLVLNSRESKVMTPLIAFYYIFL